MVASADKVVVLALSDDDWRTVRERMAEFERAWFELNIRMSPATRTTPRLCLVVVDGAVAALGLMTSQGSSGDVDTRIRVADIHEVPGQVSVLAILTALTPTQKRWAGPVLRGGGVLPPQAGRAVIRAVSELSADVGAAIALLRAAQDQPRAWLSGAFQLIEEQRDAVALGLELTGIDSRRLVPSAAAQRDAAPFLSALPFAGTSEASLIRHDASHFSEWIPQDGTIHDVIEFSDPSDPERRVTVMYADREALELVTGTDLIYFRHHLPGYVLVQYKRMQKDPDAQRGKEWTYRPDGQLGTEIDRMRKIQRQAEATDVNGWRLTPEPFYIKLVQDGRARSIHRRLVPGMYFPLGLFEVILQSPRTRGPRGGRQIGWHNAQRWLTNTNFVDLMIDGWIGSTGNATDEITQLIAATLQMGRGAVVVRDDTDPTLSYRSRTNARSRRR